MKLCSFLLVSYENLFKSSIVGYRINIYVIK